MLQFIFFMVIITDTRGSKEEYFWQKELQRLRPKNFSWLEYSVLLQTVYKEKYTEKAGWVSMKKVL